MRQMISVCATDWQTQLSPRLTQGAVFNKLGGGDRVDFTETARWYQKHDSRCLHAQLTTHSSGLVEKVALVFQIEIGNQLATFNSGGKENKDVEKRSNTNKQSNNCSNSDMWSPWCYKITTEGLCLSEKLARFALSV